MVMPRPGTIASRLIALGLLVAVAAAIGFGAVRPIAAVYASMFQEVRQLRQTLASHQQTEREAEKLRHQLAELRTAGPLSSLVMAPSSDGAALAKLQGQLAQTIESSGALLTSIQALPAQPAGALRRVGLRLQVTADTNSLRAILHALEFARPIAVLDNVFVHSQSARAVGVERPLTVRLDVFAFLPGQA